MNRYNKGVTIVEILLSIVIVGLVLVALFNLLISVRKDSESNQIQSQYVLNQSEYVQMIEEDITQYGVSSVSSCDVYDVDIDSFNINDQYRSDFKCIRIDYSADYLDDNIGYIMVLNYNYKYTNNGGSLIGKESAWMIRYTRGHYDENNKWVPLNTHMNEFPDNTSLEGKVSVTFNRSNPAESHLDAAIINIPIVSQSGEHYDINLSMLLNSDREFYCYTGGTGSNTYAKVNCTCNGYCDNLIKNSSIQ